MTTLILLLTLLQNADSLKAGLREEPSVTPQTERLQAVANLSAQLRAEEPPQSEYYVVVFSSPGCIPCRQFARSREMARIKERYTVREIDFVNPVGLRPGESELLRFVSAVPQVWLCSVKTTRQSLGNVRHVFVGAVTVDELRARE